MNPDAFAALEKSLLEKIHGLDALLELAGQHREALIHQDIDALTKINESQTEELSRLDRIQKSSGKLLGRLAMAVGQKPESATLTAICPALPTAQGDRLSELSQQLQGRAADLAMASEMNAGLSANALKFIRISLQSVSSEMNEAVGAGSGPASLVLDQRA